MCGSSGTARGGRLPSYVTAALCAETAEKVVEILFSYRGFHFGDGRNGLSEGSRDLLVRSCERAVWPGGRSAAFGMRKDMRAAERGSE